MTEVGSVTVKIVPELDVEALDAIADLIADRVATRVQEALKSRPLGTITVNTEGNQYLAADAHRFARDLAKTQR